MLKKLALLSASLVLVSGHSWIHCTKYQMNEANLAELETYDDSKCKGYPRHFKDFDRGFGVDAGYNFQIDASADTAAPCRTGFNDGTPYTTDHPMATYSPGERVCLTWPTKNHVASSCNNPYIVDGGVKIFRSAVNPTSQASKSQLEKNLVVDMGATQTPANTDGQALYTRPGYQRCPKFCSNNDKAMCSQCFTVPSDLAPGVYTFSWFWIFNAGQLYTSCWEAQVGPGGASPTSAPGAPTSAPTVGKPSDLGLDMLAFAKVPTTITPSGPFETQVQYNSGGNRKIVVDILSVPDYKFYGNGVADVTTGSGTVKIQVTPQNTPPAFQSYIVKAWIVDKAKYDSDPANAYQFELSRIDSPVTVGEKTVYDKSSSSASNKGAIAGAFFGGFFLCAIILGIAFFLYKKQAKV